MEVQREENVRKNDFLMGLEREDYSARKRVHDEDKDVCEGEEKNILACFKMLNGGPFPHPLAKLEKERKAFPPHPALLLGEWPYWHPILT